jgi:hypothetical protein
MQKMKRGVMQSMTPAISFMSIYAYEAQEWGLA